MKAYLINPFDHTITQVEYTGTLDNIYELIQASPITTVGLSNGTWDQDVIYVDDEGLYRENQRYFLLRGYPQPLAGRGLVLGTNEEGDSVEPKISLPELRGLIMWARPELRVAGFENYEGVEVHPVFGRVNVIGHKPVFTTDPDDDGSDKE